jgi:hypothetical protein
MRIVWAHHGKLSKKNRLSATLTVNHVEALFNFWQKTVKKVSVISPA